MRLTALLFCVLLALPAAARSLADVEIRDRTDGRVLPLVLHRSRFYVAGEPGHDYEVLLRNRTAGRLLAVTSVDGVNVITGETAAPDQGGYVLDGWGTTRISGWRKSLSRVARFYFTALPDSYAARTGRPENVGVIGVALYRERTPCCTPEAPASVAGEARQEAAPGARDAARLGTGHGDSDQSPAQYTRFDRASVQPTQTIEIYYDSWRNLLARGIVRAPVPQDPWRPDPFPARFVPDPP